MTEIFGHPSFPGSQPGTVDEVFAEINQVFYDKFGTNLWLYPRGSAAGKRIIRGVMHEDSLGGTNEHTGDGVTVNRGDGKTERRSATFDILDDYRQYFQDTVQDELYMDVLEDNNGLFWKCKRLTGSDEAGMFSVLAVQKNASNRRDRSRGG